MTVRSAVSPSLPDVAHLRPRQQMAMDCALCGVRLGTSGRILGNTRYRGMLFRLWACDPVCTPHVRGPR